jgi:hypothetical protein
VQSANIDGIEAEIPQKMIMDALIKAALKIRAHPRH